MKVVSIERRLYPPETWAAEGPARFGRLGWALLIDGSTYGEYWDNAADGRETEMLVEDIRTLLREQTWEVDVPC